MHDFVAAHRFAHSVHNPTPNIFLQGANRVAYRRLSEVEILGREGKTPRSSQSGHSKLSWMSLRCIPTEWPKQSVMPLDAGLAALVDEAVPPDVRRRKTAA